VTDPWVGWRWLVNLREPATGSGPTATPASPGDPPDPAVAAQPLHAVDRLTGHRRPGARAWQRRGEARRGAPYHRIARGSRSRTREARRAAGGRSPSL